MEDAARNSDHAMAAEFGQSRSMRQSSRVGCRDEFHGERVAQALARQVAKENPSMLVSYRGSTNIDMQQMSNAGRHSTRLDDMDPRVARRRQAEVESEMRRREREQREEDARKAKLDEEATQRRAETAKVKKRQEDGLAERRKLDEQKAAKRRERLGLPLTASAEDCIKREKKLKKLEREADKKGEPFVNPYMTDKTTEEKQSESSATNDTITTAANSTRPSTGGESSKPDPSSLLDSLAASWGVVGNKRPAPASDVPADKKKSRSFQLH